MREGRQKSGVKIGNRERRGQGKGKRERRERGIKKEGEEEVRR